MVESVLIFGAGNIGRGFIGQLFSESGYHLHFVEVDKTLINALNVSHGYQVLEVDNATEELYLIEGVDAHLSRNESEIVALLAEVSVAATAVGVRNLHYYAPIFAKAIQRRMKVGNETPLNVLICENLMNGAQIFEKQICEYLNTEEQKFMSDRIGVVGTVIGRSVPPLSTAYASTDPSFIVVEHFREFVVNKIDFVGVIPKIQDMTVTDHYDACVARKLYVHNCSHATLAYLGYLHGYELSCEAIEDPAIYEQVKAGMLESSQAMSFHYSFTNHEMKQYYDGLLQRYPNHRLKDTNLRIAKDPIRKLQPEDRLVGAARMAESAGVSPVALSVGIAAAYCFDPESDPVACELQRMIEKSGIEKVLFEVSHIDPDEDLGRLVLEGYKNLRK